jgi:hypothetical protein
MRNICFNLCLNTNEAVHFFLFCSAHVCRPLPTNLSTRVMADAGCTKLKNKDGHDPHSVVQQVFWSAHCVQDTEEAYVARARRVRVE